MNQKHSNPGLQALYTRLDEIRMSQAERQQARAALAQADAAVDLVLDLARLVKRLAGARARTGYSAT